MDPSVDGSLAFWLMPLHVKSQVIGSREGSLADTALERLGSRVLAVVTSEFVRAGEAPLALGPLTVVRLLT